MKLHQLHPEFIRLAKKELSLPLAALVLVASLIGWFQNAEDISNQLQRGFIEITTPNKPDGSTPQFHQFSIDVSETARCTTELARQLEEAKLPPIPDARERCQTEQARIQYERSLDFFTTILVLILLVSFGRMLAHLSADQKANTADYHWLGTYPPGRLALARVFGGSLLGLWGLGVNLALLSNALPDPGAVLPLAVMSVLGMQVAVCTAFLGYTYQIKENRIPSLALVWVVGVLVALAAERLLPTGGKLFDLYDLHRAGIIAFYDVPLQSPWFQIGAVTVLVAGLLSAAVALQTGWQGRVSMLWVAFVLLGILWVYVGGMEYWEIYDKTLEKAGRSSPLFAAAVALAYLSALLGNRSLARWARLRFIWDRTGRWPWRDTPAWVAFLGLAVASLPLTAQPVLAMAIIGCLVRDLAILHLSSLFQPNPRGDYLGLLVLGLLYWLLPGWAESGDATSGLDLLWGWGQALVAVSVLVFAARRQQPKKGGALA